MDFEEARLIDLITEYADHHPSFDRSFIDSVSLWYDQYGELTEAQAEACDKIAKRFRMKEWKKHLNEVPKIAPWEE